MKQQTSHPAIRRLYTRAQRQLQLQFFGKPWMRPLDERIDKICQPRLPE